MKQLSYPELVGALQYFASQGTQRIKFTGGEPFLFFQILQLIEECRFAGMEPTVITNGTILPPGAIQSLKAQQARIKVSLHGPRSIHNAIQNKEVYDVVIATVRKLIAAGIQTSIHTMLYKGFELDLERWVDFLVIEGVHKVSFMTFVPRGRGHELKQQWEFTADDLEALSSRVNALANKYQASIIIRHLDFARKPYLVFETDGSLVWEVGEETTDQWVRRIDLSPPSSGPLEFQGDLGTGGLVSLGLPVP